MNMEDEMLDTTTTTLPCQIVTLTNEHPDFYPMLGPFLARRAIAQEMGGPLWDDDGMQWFVALSPEGKVLGFAALRQKAGRIEFDSAFVLPAWRGQGIYRQLLEARFAACPAGATLRALTTSKSVDALVRRGFTIRRYRGQYAEVEMVKKEG
jgi:GNAT superfamily N-acetyltransferase